jgi:hypothetical protein
MHEVVLPQDTASSPAPVATGAGRSKWSGPELPGTDDEEAGVDGVVRVVAVGAAVPPPQPATTAVQTRSGNQYAGRTSDHLAGPGVGLWIPTYPSGYL